MRFKEESILNCVAYLDNTYLLSSDGQWHEPSELFGSKISDPNNRRGYTIEPYWKMFKLPVRIARKAFIILKFMEANKQGNMVLLRWKTGRPTKDMAISLLKLSYELKKSNDSENDEILSKVSPQAKKTIDKMVSKKQKSEKLAQNIVEETKKNNMEVIERNFEKLFHKIEEQENELRGLREIIGEQSNQITEMSLIFKMFGNELMKLNDNQLKAHQSRENDFKLFKAFMADVKTMSRLNKTSIDDVGIVLNALVKKGDALQTEVVKIRNKDKHQILVEVMEKYKEE